jgi:branched-chain amino acid transport system permease protein
MCVGLTLTYMTTKVPNFAHANFVVFAIFSGATAFIFGGFASPYMTLPVAALAGAAVAVLLYLLVLKPLTQRGANIVVLMIATLAAGIVFDAAVAAIFISFIGQKYAKFLSDKGYYLFNLNQLPDFHAFGMPGILFVAPAAMILVTIGIVLLLRTRFGIAMRAAIENPNLARILGINVERVYLISWFIAGLLAGIGGGLFSIQSPSPPSTSSNIIVDIFSGVVLGGIGSIYGGIIGGFIVGFSETYGIRLLTVFADNTWGYQVGSQLTAFQKGIPLAIMIITLLVIPKGLTSLNWRKILRLK